MIHNRATSADAAPPAASTSPDDVSPQREASSRRLKLGVGAVLVGCTSLTYLATFFVVRAYYATHLPHYDSIGSYGYLFQMLNDVHHHGLAATLARADTSSMTWLQPAYTLLLAWAPVKAPEWLVSLNFVLLLIAQVAIVTYGRTVGYSPQRQVVTALLPLAPGALYAWDGGIQDLRRDNQLVLLALAILFLALAHVLAPSWRRALALGMVVGLAQWSRDNAASVIAVVAVPPLALAILRSRQHGGFAGLLKIGMLPIAVFLLVTLPYYTVTIRMTLARYTTSVWGIGENRLESLAAWWSIPASVLLGGDMRLGGRVEVAAATAVLLVVAAVLVGVLWRAGVVQLEPRRLREQPSVILLASGLWIILAVVLYTTLLLGYGARWHGMPFMPILVGLVTVLAGLLGAVVGRPGHATPVARIALIAGCLVLLASAPIRMILNQTPPLGVEGVSAVRATTIDISERAHGRPVAFLWSDGFGRHHARYYIAQADRPPLTEFELIAIANNDPIDLDQPLRPTDRPNELRRRLDRTLRRWADFVLVCEQTSRYNDRTSILWPYQLGKPVVDEMLRDPGWAPVAHYTLLGKPFVLLENRVDRTRFPVGLQPGEIVAWTPWGEQ